MASPGVIVLRLSAASSAGPSWGTTPLKVCSGLSLKGPVRAPSVLPLLPRPSFPFPLCFSVVILLGLVSPFFQAFPPRFSFPAPFVLSARRLGVSGANFWTLEGSRDVPDHEIDACHAGQSWYSNMNTAMFAFL